MQSCILIVGNTSDEARKYGEERGIPRPWMAVDSENILQTEGLRAIAVIVLPTARLSFKDAQHLLSLTTISSGGARVFGSGSPYPL